MFDNFEVVPGLAKFRRLRGIQQKAVAIAAGIPITTLSKIENGRMNPSLEEVRWIARALGASESEVIQCLKVQGSSLWEAGRGLTLC